ncbi:MAG: DUF5110 domain-containing protein [Bacteroidales bacterium]|nr:DUF5110 domain-containing protein [Bacteroidales bacterium]
MKSFFRFLLPALLALVFNACQSRIRYFVQGNEVTVCVVPSEEGPSRVRLQVLDEEIVRVSAVRGGRFADRQSLVVVPQPDFRDFRVEKTEQGVRVSTAKMAAVVHPDGNVWFYDDEGRLRLGGGQLSLQAREVEGKKGFSTRVSYETWDDESLYGLGQHQTGEFDRKGTDEELYQYNTKISVPFVVSTYGYGLLFDAYSYSRWGNPAPYGQLGERFRLFDKDGVEGALTGTYMAADGTELVRREDSLYFENEWAIRNLPAVNLNGAKVVYEGSIEAPETGEYRFTQYYAGFQRTIVDGQEVMSRRWRPAWNPNSFRFSVSLEKGVRTPVRIEWEPDGDVSYLGLRVAPLQAPEERTRLSFWSEFEPQIDYYFIAGHNYDEVLKGYRQLTGKAQVLPKWALGFWQSRERYSTQEELVGTLREFRRRGIPVDNIVQDWQYWKPDQWGSHEFEAERYPDPEQMLDDVHALHGRFMISVWPKFYTATDNYKELEKGGYVYHHAVEDSLKDWLGHYQTFYDAYAEGGRKLFWKQMDEDLYSRYGRKIDAWWMDASEPNLRDCLPKEYMQWLLTPTALGPATEYYNAYALVNAQAIYEGQRSVDSDKRVFLLTRNGFAGLQRYSTASWSGDIGTTWTDMKMQITAGLGYSMSGLPFWGMDTGGFSVLSKFYDAANRDEWQELQARWHQFCAFVPLFRAHGQWPQREIWNIAPKGSPAYESILYYMRLRYRLMPYLYSLAGAVHFEDYTLMRGLPMDFPSDLQARQVADQWLFGPALMPCPVCEYKARSREVYFPVSARDRGWYDFYTEEPVAAGQTLTVPAPYGRIPLFVRAGSILPLGPDMQWSDEKAADPIELRIYPGADADFRLYEDDGVSYAYEKGNYSVIPIHWDDASRTLTINSREGSFPGMLQSRTFNVRLAGASTSASLTYEGQAVSLRM